MDILFIDFETKDKGIDAGLGAGWPYNDMVKVLGYSYAINTDDIVWSTSVNKLKALVASVDAIVCHNALYDIGILEMLKLDYGDKIIYDTLVMSRLYDNNLMKHNLDYLSEKYFSENKSEEKFKEIAYALKLVKSKVQDPVKYCKANLDKVYEAYPEVVIEYAIQDVALLRKLFNKYQAAIEGNQQRFFDQHDWNFYSDLIKCVVDIRRRGVRIDIRRLYNSRELVQKDLFDINLKLGTYLQGRNPNSSAQLAQICDELGVTYPRTDKGNPSITAKWVEDQEGEFFDLLKTYRKLNKIENDFITKTINMLKVVENVDADEQLLARKYSRLHPELNIMGATATGRFSSSNFNVQQLPKRDPYAKPLVRSMIVPEEGDTWYCADFSAQEPRLQVNYAALIGSTSGAKLAEAWREDPFWDMHSEVAKLCGIDRPAAKTINLGLSYGMGVTKLAKSLNLSVAAAKSLIQSYNKGAPYLKELDSAVKKSLERNLYIRTALGRKLRKDSDAVDDNGRIQDFLYKGINKLIQGSAADQTMAALVSCYRHKVYVNFPVHDEITLSSSSVLDAAKLKYIMENVFKLLVPSVSEVTCGTSFADQEDTALELTPAEQEIFNKFCLDFVPIKSFS